MKFKKKIQGHKSELEFNINTEKIWNGIKIPSRKKSFVLNNIGFLTIIVLLLVAVITANSYFKNLEKLNQKTENQKKEMYVLANHKKTSNRIIAVNMADDFNENDNEVMEILLDRFLNDESESVRMAALNGLSKYIKESKVRLELINQLSTTHDVYLKMRLIDILSKVKEKSIVPTLHLLQKELNDEDPLKETVLSGIKLIEA